MEYFVSIVNQILQTLRLLYRIFTVVAIRVAIVFPHRKQKNRKLKT